MRKYMNAYYEKKSFNCKKNDAAEKFFKSTKILDLQTSELMPLA